MKKIIASLIFSVSFASLSHAQCSRYMPAIEENLKYHLDIAVPRVLYSLREVENVNALTKAGKEIFFSMNASEKAIFLSALKEKVEISYAQVNDGLKTQVDNTRELYDSYANISLCLSTSGKCLDVLEKAKEAHLGKANKNIDLLSSILPVYKSVIDFTNKSTGEVTAIDFDNAIQSLTLFDPIFRSFMETAREEGLATAMTVSKVNSCLQETP